MTLTDPYSPLRKRVRALIPLTIQRKLLLYRRLPVYRRAGIVFIHVPKNAGSSVNEVLFGKFIGHFTAEEVFRADPKLKSIPSFALARNPWARALSAYRFARNERGEGGKVTAYINRAAQYRVPEFETFERFVREWLPFQDIETADPVFRLQTSYVCNNRNDILVEHVGRVENLEPTTQWLEQRINRKIAFPQSNRTAAGGNFQDAYSPETRKIIGEIYGKDAEIFGYRFDDGW